MYWSRTVQNFSRWHQSEQLRKKANKVDIYEYLDHGKAITALLLSKKLNIIWKRHKLMKEQQMLQYIIFYIFKNKILNDHS